MSENFISVVCASKNEENDITNLITSFNLQDYPNKELIIIDDSSDETRSIVNSYIKESIDSNIILIEGDFRAMC